MAFAVGRLRSAHCAVAHAATTHSAAEVPLGHVPGFLPVLVEAVLPPWSGTPWLARYLSSSPATQAEQPSGSFDNRGSRERQGRRHQGGGADSAGPHQRLSREHLPSRDGGDNGTGRPSGYKRNVTDRKFDNQPQQQQHTEGGHGPQRRSSDGPTAGPRGPRGGQSTIVPLAIQKGSAVAKSASQMKPGKAAVAPQRWDLVAMNTPRRVFRLIGDPRTGVADDTTTNPFGEVTVDMIHHQPSNEVYWFKYEFTGGQQRGAHRDARLSDYTRNLIYLLRAKDPKRWTIPALAEKFRVRKQRLLAILALKELEAQRIEDGKLLSGPLSAYALTLHPGDIVLRDPSGAGGTPAAPAGGKDSQPAAAEAEAQHRAAAQQFHVDSVLRRVLATTQQLQARLLDLLRAHGLQTDRVRQALLAEVQAAEDLAAKVLGTAEGAEGYLKEELAAYRGAVEAVAQAVEAVVACSPPLQEELQGAALRAAVETALQAAAEAVRKERSGGPAPSQQQQPATPPPASPALQTAKESVEKALEPALKAGGDAALQRIFFNLPLAARGSLLDLLPDVAARLRAAGVDLQRCTKDASYRGQAATAAAAGDAAKPGGSSSAVAVRPTRLRVDVFGFQPVPGEQQERLAGAVQALGQAQAALVGKVEALVHSKGGAATQGAPAAAPAVPPATEAADLVATVRSLLRQYVAADAMWADLQIRPRVRAAKRNERRQQLQVLEPEKKRKMLEVLAKADPSAISRALQVEAAMRLRKVKKFQDIDALTAGVGATAAAAQAASSGGEAAPPARPGDRARWEALAAYLDVKVAGRVYGTGSGERHVTRLPTFPAFEGYSLEEFDQAKEGELSALNRKTAEREDAEMYDRFRQDLLYNLGVRGEKIRESSLAQPAWPANLNTVLERPVVVYDIGSDGATQYPPLYVATGDGAKRPLNEQEQVFQGRRALRPRLPYYMGRIATIPELE